MDEEDVSCRRRARLKVGTIVGEGWNEGEGDKAADGCGRRLESNVKVTLSRCL